MTREYMKCCLKALPSLYYVTWNSVRSAVNCKIYIRLATRTANALIMDSAAPSSTPPGWETSPPQGSLWH